MKRKGERLGRICDDCECRFIPTGRGCKFCKDCAARRISEGQERRKRRGREGKK